VTDDVAQVERVTLIECLDQEWLKLPLAAMQQVGPAVQTLAGILKITNRETFSPIADIARHARLPAATVKKHVRRLDEAGWIENAGRGHTRRGAPRRTATLKITKQTKDHIAPYGMLPWWSCCSIRKVGRLPWCARAVLSIVVARLCSLKAAADRQQDNADAEELAGAIDNLGGDERFRFSLKWLTEQTGLTRESVVTAKGLLNHRYGIVRWTGNNPQLGVTTPTDLLMPNWKFRVVVTPAPKGGVYLAFHRGSDSGP
jgi:hypothetical protein